jgi:predicted nucleotidyltransferase/predicted transcriptional regulator of viral defense system
VESRVEKYYRLFEVAKAHQGYFTSADAKKLGYDYPHQHFHVKKGNWIRVDHGIFRLKNFPAARDEDLIRWWLWTRKKGVLSHDSAAAVYDLGDILPSRVHITVPADFRKKAPKGVTLHKSKLMVSDFDMRDGFLVTKPLRTIVDLTLAHMDPERLSAIINDAIQKGMVEKREVSDLSSKLPDQSARRILEIAIAEASQTLDVGRTMITDTPRFKETPLEWRHGGPSIRDLLLQLKAGLRLVYGERLKGVYVFGSYARGEADRESDLDVLVVLQTFDRYAQEVDHTGGLAAELSLKYGVSVSLVFMREPEWLNGDTPFLSNVRDEAIPA